MKADNKPLFTLTAEEVELTKQALMLAKNQIIESYVRFPAIEAYLVKERDKIFKLLDRIKQWQDENGNK